MVATLSEQCTFNSTNQSESLAENCCARAVITLLFPAAAKTPGPYDEGKSCTSADLLRLMQGFRSVGWLHKGTLGKACGCYPVKEIIGWEKFALFAPWVKGNMAVRPSRMFVELCAEKIVQLLRAESEKFVRMGDLQR